MSVEVPRDSNDDAPGGAKAPISGWWIALAVVAVNLLVYGQVLWFEAIDGWDDYLYFFDHHLLHHWPEAGWSERLLTPEIGYPGPIPTLLYFLVHRLPEALVFPAAHGLNLLLHLVNLGLVYVVGKRLLQSRRAAWVVAVLWSVHPLLAETIAWISNLKSVGMATAMLAALWVWMRFLEAPKTRYLVAAGVLLVVGLGFKPPAVVLLPLLLGVALVRKPQVVWRLRTIVFSVVTGVFTAVYLWIARRIHHGFIQEDGYAATAGGLWPTMERMGGAFFVQMRNIVYPHELHPMYFPGEVGGGQVIVGWAALLGLVGCTVWAVVKCRDAAPGLVVFWMTYLPHSGLEYLPRFTADTYMYLPLLGLLWSACAVVRRVPPSVAKRWGRAAKIAFVAAVVALAVVAFFQTARWANSSTLWKPLLQDHPDQYEPYHLVGEIYFSRGDYDEAVQIYEAGMEHFSDAAGDRAMALARALEMAGRPGEARDHMVRILAGEFPRSDSAASYAMYLMVSYELSVPPPGQGREEIVAAALEVLDRGELEASHAEHGARYFRDQGEEKLAQIYEDYAQRLRQE